MKLWCECEKEWRIQNSFDQRQICLDDIQIDPKRGQSCPQCTFNFWIDADHENMMHDLKQMNS